jgi:hypothetical protein
VIGNVLLKLSIPEFVKDSANGAKKQVLNGGD